MFKLAERKTENSELVKIKMEMSAVNNQCLGFFQTPILMQISKEQNSSNLSGIMYCRGLVTQRGLSAGNRH